jgi:hypothetical protein
MYWGSRHMERTAQTNQIYAKLLVVEETDGEGKPVKRERRRFANAAMTACRRAWFVAQRAEERKVPPVNPFAEMGLKTRSVGRAPRETPTATGTRVPLPDSCG